ncbi:hypothetical protein VNO77_18190 [Canavalia gladiata]|uniref:Uncharacterized protein n=1 Tax=Canavalia gladiata TaxID=3824 RepID=A0AAN9QJE4_CANGL
MASDETMSFVSCLQEEQELDDNLVSMCVSRLSIESLEGDDGDADGELSSESENELGSCYSLPCTPPRRRNRDRRVKEYASDNEVRKGRRSEKNKRKEEHAIEGFSGESDQSGGGTGVMLITRPKGGNRTLCMDLEEVKACRDLGFELEHQRMLEMPPSLSFSNSTLDTSSGSNSPIANWRISAPGDDPRDVKARLKVWAQAVALASASKYGS